MSKSSLHPSRTKYLALLKQTTAIEFEIVQPEHMNENLKCIRQVASGDSIILKNQALNTFQRAQRRQQLNESRQQSNLEQIFSLALEYINQDAHFDRIDLDWMMRFTELAKNVYSATMQELWAKILAVELSHSGAFSYKSLKTLSELSSKEAKLFYRAVNLACRLGEDRSSKIITGVYKKPTLISIFSKSNRVSINLSKFGLSYTQLISLAEIGLIYEQEIESTPRKANESINLTYQGKNHQLKVKQNDITVTYYKFTQTGEELLKLVSNEQNQDYLSSLLKEFKTMLEIQGSLNQQI
ncbi:MAG: TIGR03899 family protein [Gammaproteobacteria bacterium]|nr:TIGR03899 family protein [Gammaproteobacteria bacterium]